MPCEFGGILQIRRLESAWLEMGKKAKGKEKEKAPQPEGPVAAAPEGWTCAECGYEPGSETIPDQGSRARVGAQNASSEKSF